MSARSFLVAIVGIALLVGLGGGYLISTLRQSHTESDTTRPSPERKVLYWQDPMVPGTKFDKPGKSPFMDMDLVPVYADEAGSANVQIAPQLAQSLGIRLGAVQRRVFSPKLQAVGNIAVDERRISVVQSRVAGTLTKLKVKTSLQSVRRGEVLAEVLSPEWIGAQREYLMLLDAQSDSSKDLRRAARERLEVLGVPEQTVQAIEAKREMHATTQIYAPIDGVITELAIREGSTFDVGDTLFQITDLRTVWVNAQVPESQVSLVSLGASVRVTATAWPGQTFEGRVIAILPEVDPQTRTLAVRVEVRNQDERLAPGMYVTVELAGASSREVLVVPSEALISTGERTAVIVGRENGGFDVVEVTVGLESEGFAEIRSGLSEDDTVVISGQFLIDSEASLRSTVNRLSSQTQRSETQTETQSETQTHQHEHGDPP